MIRQVLDPASYIFNAYAIPSFAATGILLLLGLLILIHERASRVSRLFALVILTVSGWLFAFSWMYSSTNESVALWWAKAAYLGVPSIAPAIYHFTAVALQIYPRCKRLVWIGWILSALFSITIVGTDALFAGLYRYWWGYYPKYGWFSVPYLTFFFGMMVASLRNYWIEYRTALPGTRKRRIRIFMLALVLAYLATVDYAAKFGVPLYPIGSFAVLGWLGLVAVAIWRHQFVDITPAFAAEQITNTMTETLLVLDHEGVVRVANRAACQLFGYSEAKLVGQPISLIRGDFFPREKMETLFQTGSVPNYSVSYPASQDRVLSLELSASVIRDRAGAPIAVVCIARDITERRQAEEAIRAKEEQFRSVAQSANDAIVSADDQGNMVSWNRGAQTIFGYREEEVLGKPLTLLMPERYREGHRRGLERMRTTGEAHVIGKTVELHGLRKDGAEFPLELSLATWKTGDETFYSGILRDITERKRAEETLKEVSEFNQQIIAGAQEGIIVYDRHLRYMVWNPFMEELTGMKAEKVLGKHPMELFPFLREEGIYPLLERALAGEHSAVSDVPYAVPHTGRTGWISGKYGPLRDTNNKIIGVIGMVSDTTERKQAEEELRKSEEQLRQSQKMEAVGSFAGGIAHDFNNLLMVINGYSHLLLDRLGQGDQMYNEIEQIRQAGERATSLTHQILAFSRKQVLMPEVLDLNTVVAGMGTMLQRLISEDIHLAIRPGSALGMVKADRGQIEQVIMNLVVNARDAMPQGGQLTIETANVDVSEAEASWHMTLAAGAYVVLSVADTGCGMDVETQARIFEPFFTTKEQGKGTGLGLSTVYGIINQSRGSISVNSAPGGGATFKIYLPRVENEVKTAEFDPVVSSRLQASETVLVVEDEEMVQALLRKVLEANGYLVLEARNGQEALQLCRNHAGPIHLLITDVVMPGINGRELAGRLAPMRPDMKVLFISGHIDDAVIRRGVTEFNAAFLQKPIGPDSLIRKVREVLQGS